MSGEYILSDLYDYRSPDGSRKFAQNVLGITRGEGSKSLTGRVRTSRAMDASVSNQSISYSNTLNDKSYIVENPDLIEPSGSIDSGVFMTYSDTGLPAGILTRRGKSRGAVMTIPFETIEEGSRNQLMKEILDYLEK